MDQQRDQYVVTQSGIDLSAWVLYFYFDVNIFALLHE